MARGNTSKISMKPKTPKKPTKKIAGMGRRANSFGSLGGGGKVTR